MDAEALTDERRSLTDGEIVWSWRPNVWRSSPGEADKLRRGDGGKRKGSPGSNCVEVAWCSAGLKAGAVRHRLRRLSALTPSAPQSVGFPSARPRSEPGRRARQATAWRLASHFSPRAIMMLRMTISLRMQATRATFACLPLAIKRS